MTLVEVPYDGPTPEKIRLRSGSHPLLRLDRGVRLLTREHAAIAGVLTALQHAVEMPGVSADELRGLAEHLLRTFSRHRQRGADLLWQAYQTDLGGET